MKIVQYTAVTVLWISVAIGFATPSKYIVSEVCGTAIVFGYVPIYHLVEGTGPGDCKNGFIFPGALYLAFIFIGLVISLFLVHKLNKRSS